MTETLTKTPDSTTIAPETALLIDNRKIRYVCYENETEMPAIMKVMQNELSEPYSIYTYRYFIHNWPELCFLVRYPLSLAAAASDQQQDECIAAIVCKLDYYRNERKRGYIAMLAVDPRFRGRGIATNLVRLAIEEMIRCEADEIVLETEVTNHAAMKLYEKLGFVRDKRLFRYYMNGVDAFRLKLWLK